MDELLKIRNLTVRYYTYDGIVRVLEGLNLDINRGETYGLVGETGCGKTQTALAILRLIPPPGQIERGSIQFYPDNGHRPLDLLTIGEDEIRKLRGSQISMIFQEPGAVLDPVYTIGDQIAETTMFHRRRELAEQALKSVETVLARRDGLGALLTPLRLFERGLYRQLCQDLNAFLPGAVGRIPLLRKCLWRIRDEAGKIAVGALKEVEIPDAGRIARQYPHQLSGGMKQRSVIAMALVGSPRFLIADEPTTALDVTIQAQIIRLLQRLKEERNSSILYITHDLGVAAEICDRVGVMYAGSLCEEAKVADLFASPRHPYTRGLLAALPKPGKEPATIGGSVPGLIDPPPGCRFHPRCESATGLCREHVPAMREVAPGHFIACHTDPEETDGRPG